MGKLDGKVALITGAGSGIGRATALLFATEGARVVVVDRVADGGLETAKMVEDAGDEAVFIQTDVSKSFEVERMVKETLVTYERIDILFNNAGIMGTMALTAELTEEDWDTVLDVNLKSVFLCSKNTIPAMLQQGNGVIINTASVHGMIRVPGCPAYGASKAGIVLLTRQMAAEYARRNIRVNCICPGLIESGITAQYIPALELDYIPQGRAGQAEEVARAALYLASDDSTYVTGTSLVVDGGWTTEVRMPLKESPTQGSAEVVGF